MCVCACKGPREPTYCFVELHLLLQVQANDAVVVIDPVAMEVIHLSYNQNQDISQFPQSSTDSAGLLCSVSSGWLRGRVSS